MANRPDLIDHINQLRDQLHLLAMAALSLHDSDFANAMHHGAREAISMADEIKAMVLVDVGLETDSSTDGAKNGG